MTDYHSCTVQQVEAILVFLQGQRLQFSSLQLLMSNLGGHPNLSICMGGFDMDTANPPSIQPFSKFRKKFFSQNLQPSLSETSFLTLVVLAQ